MKKSIKILLCITISLQATQVDSSDYRRTNTPLSILVQEGPRSYALPQKESIKRVAAFAIREFGVEADIATEFGVACSQRDDWKSCGAIIAAESSFNPEAVGKDGSDQGSMQVHVPDHGDVPDGIVEQVDQGMQIFEDALKVTKGNRQKAYRYYNGGPGYKSKPITRTYSQRVDRYRRMI